MNQVFRPPTPVPIPDSGELTGPLVLFPMTSAQYAALPICRRVQMELLDGKVVIMPKPRPRHQRCATRLCNALDNWVTSQGLGEILSEVDVELDGDWMPAPDIVYLRKENLGRLTETGIVGPVDLAVEVLSPSHPETDRGTKFVGYARNGVPWYWIVDLDARTLEEYELVAGEYVNRNTAPFDQPFTPRLFPGLALDLVALSTLAT